MNIDPHRRASDEYQNRVDAALKALGLAHFTHAESLIVDDWSCNDFPADGCAEYIAKQRAESTAT
jgi:hypothetical protein